MSNIPGNWKLYKLGDLIRLKNGYAFKSQDYSGKGIPLIRISDINNNEVTAEYAVKIPRDKVKEDFFVTAGDLLIAMSGATTGKTGVYNGREPVLQNQRVGNFKIIDENIVDKKYRNYYIESLRKDIEQAAYGGAQPNISSGNIEAFDFPLAPMNEQKLVVAEIEKQFSRLDEAVANLKRVKSNLKRYKAAVLKAAVEGHLVETEADLARREGRSYETGEQLLRRVHDTRRSQWKGKSKFREHAPPDTSDLPDLPEGWVWSNFENVAERVTVGHVGPMKNEYVGRGIPFLRSQNVRANRFDPEGLKFISEKFHRQLEKSLLRPGDIVVVRSGSVGISCVMPDQVAEANCADLVIVKVPHSILPKYGAYYMNAVVETRVAAGKVGVALTHFNTQSVANLPLPVPPLPEQQRIVVEVDRCLSIASEAATQVEVNLKRAEHLRQTILGKAFQGNLFQ